MLQTVRKTFMLIAALAAIGAGAAAFAGAATTTTKSRNSSDPPSARPDGPPQTQLSGDSADKVKAAALAKVPGATILRVESGGPEGSAYHAHVRKADGSEVVVLVDANFEATAVQTGPPGGPHGGPGDHRGGPGGPGGPRHGDETALTGDTAAKVKAAALAKVPGATIERVETDADHGSPYEAHMRKSDGTEVDVLVDKDFSVTAVNETGRRP